MTSSEYRKLSLLLSNIKNGSRESFAEIYKMYEKKVYFLFCKLLKSKSLAKKMTVEFFSFIYLQSSAPVSADKYEKWIYTALFTNCRRYLAENQPEAFGDYLDTDSPAGNNIDSILSRDSDEMVKFPDGIDISEDMMQTVDSIISDLPLKLRIATLLYYFCGFEFNEIASCEHISLMAVRNRLYKAHIRLETEEHKYSEIGYDCAGIVIFMPDVLTTMADSIVIPNDIASGVTARTGINCLASNKNSEDVSGAATSYINLPTERKSENYVTTKYARPAPPPEKSFFESMSPTVKVLTAIVALLMIIGGTVAVVLAIQGNNRQNDNDGTVADIGNTTMVQTTIQETTTEPETTTVPETTTEPETTTVPETTTQPETTTVPETTTQPVTTTKPETTTADTGNNNDEPAGGDIDINENPES
ncbi:MAG: sigma-70 family RNA polymerase sigma factor [Clostridia bacterium]|nr:sigma-70 family RNA polymerase sigma factor [Clostridia bacterium]